MTKEAIDNSINEILNNEISFKVTSLALIKMMADDGDLKGEIYFYTYIANDLFDDLDSATYEEREEFLILHKSLIEVYNGLYN